MLVMLVLVLSLLLLLAVHSFAFGTIHNPNVPHVMILPYIITDEQKQSSIWPQKTDRDGDGEMEKSG